MYKIRIDGKIVEIEKSQTILEAAKSIGVYIPTLCYHPALEPYGACRLCLVEITKEQWNGWSRLVASCAYPVENDLIVYTNSEKVIKARKFILELLLARCPESEVIQNLAQKYCISHSRFSNYLRRNSQPSPFNHLTIQPSPHLTNCILCGLCVGVCSEIVGESAISFAYRSINRKVLPPFDKPSDVCLTCGACAFVCPTGAIKLEDIVGKRKINISKAESELVKCKNCKNYYVTLKVSDRIKLKLNEISDLIDLCPKCRRKATIEKYL
ncbi:MAG: 2Fe-2S iron-sulfur cluster-binding protein [Elusimicrobiota bacterium]|nr:2Fe-2S iron-sulfur cluster-binding protein [Elusimicrobiota bacterium]